MDKVMISMPINGRTQSEICDAKNRAVEKLKILLKDRNYVIVNSLFDYNKHDIVDRGVMCVPLYYLAKSLEEMSKCNIVYFCKGWENARGCRIENDAALDYRLEVIYE